MKVALSFDSFKNSVDNYNIHNACKKAIHDFDEGIEIVSYPLADGGEGTRKILENEFGWESSFVIGYDVLNRKKKLSYLKKNKDIYIEVADVIGLELVKGMHYDPMEINAEQLGNFIRNILAIEKAECLYVGVGGTATNDAGMGMLSALGYEFLDFEKNAISPTPASFHKICSVKIAPLPDISIVLISDVKNKLVGEEGATLVYGSQKGYENLGIIDKEIKRIYELINTEVMKKNHRDVAEA